MPDGCAMRYPRCCPASRRGGRRAETGRRIFGRWPGSTRNCSVDAALPEADWNIARCKAQTEIHAIGPLIIILEIAAGVLAGDEAADAMSHSRHLAACTQVSRITAIGADHVALGSRVVVGGAGRN